MSRRILDKLPAMTTTTTAVAALALLYALNKKLSHRSVNPGPPPAAWDNRRELVLLTGGSGGIGKHILGDLCRLETRVVVLDVVAPDFELRWSCPS